MTTSLTAIQEATETSLSDESLCWVESWDEVGMAPVDRITEQGPQQHGDTDIDFRLRPRLFSLTLGVQGVGATELLALVDLKTRRSRLLNIFKPRLNPLKLRWNFDDGAVRQIDCHYSGEMKMGIGARYGLYQQAPIILRAPDPLFYDPTMQAVTYNLGGGSGGFAVPTPVPTAIGASTIDQTRIIGYLGDFLENPIVLVRGPITAAIVRSSTTGEELAFTGYTIAAGVTVTIDTRYGVKTVIDSNGVSRIDKLTDDSDLATFHLAADPDAPLGDNSIRVTGSGVTTATEIFLQYYNRYVGF